MTAVRGIDSRVPGVVVREGRGGEDPGPCIGSRVSRVAAREDEVVKTLVRASAHGRPGSRSGKDEVVKTPTRASVRGHPESRSGRSGHAMIAAGIGG